MTLFHSPDCKNFPHINSEILLITMNKTHQLSGILLFIGFVVIYFFVFIHIFEYHSV